jgi:hypothetical protein
MCNVPNEPVKPMSWESNKLTSNEIEEIKEKVVSTISQFKNSCIEKVNY